MWNAEEEEERSDHCGLLQATNDMLRQDEFIQEKIIYNVRWGSLFFFFIPLDFFIQILHRAISVFQHKYGMYPGTTPLDFFFLREPCEPWKPATVLRTVWSNHRSSGFMLFSHREVLRAKRTAKYCDSRLIRSDRMVRSRFENYDYVYNIFTTNHRWLVIIGSNFKLTLKLLFYLNNNN